MNKSFSFFGRFLALGACASLFLACGDDSSGSSGPKRVELCEQGDMAGCLTAEGGKWRFVGTEAKWSGEGWDATSGTLVFKEDGQYEFDGEIPGRKADHAGTWELKEGNLMVIKYKAGPMPGNPASGGNSFEITGADWSNLKLVGSPFLGEDESIEDLAEIYKFRP